MPAGHCFSSKSAAACMSERLHVPLRSFSARSITLSAVRSASRAVVSSCSNDFAVDVDGNSRGNDVDEDEFYNR